jgi:multimeric flavodoxin WrbA
MKVKILGISGSPRHGNTDIMVKETLKGAEAVSDVETEFISLSDYKIKSGCISCYKCRDTNYDELCRGVKDDVNIILKKMLEADGLIIGSPVYFGGMTAQLKSLFDRSLSVEKAGFGFRNKAAGAVAVGAGRQGGHEATIMDIFRSCMVQDMIVVGNERSENATTCYWGAAGLRGYPDLVPSTDPKAITAVSEDTVGMESCKCYGRRVAKITQVVKAGFSLIDVKATS